MDEQPGNEEKLSQKVKVFGTLFLFLQVLLAINNYGPHEIPGLNLVFDEPWIPAEEISLQASMSGSDFSFEDVTLQAGLHSFYRAKINGENPSYLEVMGGGVAVGDVDGDGYEDIFLTSIPSFENEPEKEASPSTLFKNNGDGTYRDITQESGLSAIEGYPQGALFFDFNNNGRQDLYIAAYKGGQLFRNDGDTFTDITNESGLGLDGLCREAPCFGSAATAADYNRDGHLDLYIVNNVNWNINDFSQYGERQLFPAFFAAQPSFLFKNNGDGTFTDVTESSGANNEGGKGLSAIWFDLNDDQWPDLYIANDLTRNKLYLNRGDGTFTNIAPAAGVNEVKSSMGVTVADFNGNGSYDLITTNLEGSYLSLFRNFGDLRFDYATNYSGLNPSRRSSGWGVEFTDMNLDGHTDLIMAAGPVWDVDPSDAENLFFKNEGNGSFSDKTLSSGNFQNNYVSRGLAVTDIINNGRPDLIISNIDGGHPQLLANVIKSENNWLKLTLEGTESNRDAVGTKVIVERTDGLTMRQEVKAGSSYQSSSSKALFFGLGEYEAKEIKIHWPAGHVQVIQEPPLNRSKQIKEPSKVRLPGDQ